MTHSENEDRQLTVSVKEKDRGSHQNEAQEDAGTTRQA